VVKVNCNCFTDLNIIKEWGCFARQKTKDERHWTRIYADKRFVLKNKIMWYNINREGLKELVSLRNVQDTKLRAAAIDFVLTNCFQLLDDNSLKR
jgi:hypothetical protein